MSALKYTEHEETLMNEWVTGQEVTKVGKGTTIVCLQLQNGYEVIGTSFCVSGEDSDPEAAEYLARKDALKRADEVVAYIKTAADHWF